MDCVAEGMGQQSGRITWYMLASFATTSKPTLDSAMRWIPIFFTPTFQTFWHAPMRYEVLASRCPDISGGEMTQQFKTGDLVQLKSGGPPMTVRELASEGVYLCMWFSGPTLKNGSFPPDSLKAAEVPSEVSLADRIAAARKRAGIATTTDADLQ